MLTVNAASVFRCLESSLLNDSVIGIVAKGEGFFYGEILDQLCIIR